MTHPFKATSSFALRSAALAVLGAGLLACSAQADEDAIRKNLKERMPRMPAIDEVSKTPVPGLYEVRFGSDIIYTDETGTYVLEGSLFDTRSQTNLTQARVDKLTAIDFAAFKPEDAIVYKQGDGSRKMVVFADPNCGYCKRLEKELVTLKDVTIYTYVLPILGADSITKSRNLWCGADAPTAWRAWMIEGKAPVKLDEKAACNMDAIDRALEMSRKYKVQSTPTLVFEDGHRVNGAISAEQMSKHLADAKAATKS